MAASLRTVRIGPDDVADALEVLAELDEVRQLESFPHLVVDDPAELALDGACQTLLYRVLARLSKLMHDEKGGEPQVRVTFRVWASIYAKERGYAREHLIPALSGLFGHYVDADWLGIEPIQNGDDAGDAP